MYNQLSGDVFVALATLTAISGLIDALQLINAMPVSPHLEKIDRRA